MYVQRITNKKYTIRRFMTVMAFSVLPLVFVIGNPLAYAYICVSLVISYAILHYSVIIITVDPDGIYKDFNLIPMEKSRIVSSDNIAKVEHRKNENAERSNEYKFGDNVISMDVEGSVHIETKDGGRIIISSESPEEMSDAIRGTYSKKIDQN